MNQQTKDMVRIEISGFINHIDAIRKHVDLQCSTLIKEEEEKSEVENKTQHPSIWRQQISFSIQPHDQLECIAVGQNKAHNEEYLD